MNLPDCGSQVWSGPNSVQRSGSCERASATRYNCDCDGQLHSVPADSCYDALLQACDIDLLAPRYCSEQDATCWPADDQGTLWLCRCADTDTELATLKTDECSDALYAYCTTQCQDSLGECQEKLNLPGVYECSCRSPRPGDSGALSDPIPAESLGELMSCAELLAQTCHARCETLAGACEYGATEYACSCSDGSSASLVPEAAASVEAAVWADVLGSTAFVGPPLESADPCHEVLQRACGAVVQPLSVSSCSSEHEGVVGSCEPQPEIVKPGEEAPEHVRFACTCTATDTDSEAQQSEDALETLGASCTEALRGVCADSIPPPPSADGPTGDYAHLCAQDADCSGGICYLPGTGQDAICSSACSADTDCPEGTLCGSVAEGEGHCFVACDDDAECLLLNNAIENPLYCAPRADLNPEQRESGNVCIQQSEP